MTSPPTPRVQFELWDSDDVAVPRKELLQRVRGVDALLCVLTEKIDAELLDAAGGQQAAGSRALRDQRATTVKSPALLRCQSFLRVSPLLCRSQPEGGQHHVGRL